MGPLTLLVSLITNQLLFIFVVIHTLKSKFFFTQPLEVQEVKCEWILSICTLFQIIYYYHIFYPCTYFCIKFSLSMFPACCSLNFHIVWMQFLLKLFFITLIPGRESSNGSMRKVRSNVSTWQTGANEFPYPSRSRIQKESNRNGRT